MMRSLPDVLPGRRGRQGIQGVPGVPGEPGIDYWLANWAVSDWFLDSVNGDDGNDGLTSVTALASAEELSRRLAVPIPIAHPVTVHVAPGNYGTLAVSVIQDAVACPFDVVGTPTLTSIGTVTSYTDRIVASNQASHLVASGVSDWTPHVGKMLVVTAGASVGAVAWVAKANPNNGSGVPQGVDVARCSSFATVSTSLGGVRKVPGAGEGLSLADLPVFRKIAIDCRGQLPSAFASTYAQRLSAVSFVSVESVTMSGGRGLLVESCEVGNVEFLQHRNTYAQTIVRSKVKGWSALPLVEIGMADLYYCLTTGAPNTSLKLTDSRIYYGLVQGAYLTLEQAFALDVGIFDQPNAGFGACQIVSNRSARCTMANIFGRDNAREGITINTTSVTNALAQNYVTGASGDILVAAATPYYLPHTALPWVDGERSGEVALGVGGTVTVTVPFLLSTQRIVVSHKSFSGSAGHLRAAYVSSTSFTITSNEDLDRGTVTWHILPVGDNAIIRS